MRSSLAFALASIALVACSGGGSSTPVNTTPPASPPPPPPPPPPPAMSFDAVQTVIDNAPVADMAILIGDETGTLFKYEKGNFRTDERIAIASASKLVFGLVVWNMIENGTLARTSQAQDSISFWTDMAGDDRATITLDQLLGFTSGFNQPPDNAGCIGTGSIALRDCIEEIYNSGIESAPGSAFYYGPEHMQVAALLASQADGRDMQTIMREDVFDPLGLSNDTRFLASAGDNPRYSGAMRSTADDYALLLTAVLNGDLVSDRAGFLEDRTATVTFGFRPAGIDQGGFDWHYGFGFWKECDAMSYTATCDSDPTISSPGAFGFTPWIDFEHGYWGIIAIEETLINGQRPSIVSVGIEQQVQPLIEAELTP